MFTERAHHVRTRHLCQVISDCMKCIHQNNTKTEQGREGFGQTNSRKCFVFINNKLFQTKMVRLHGSAKEIRVGVNESYVHFVEDQITVIKKTDTYITTLLTRLLQSQCIVNLNENNSLHEDKLYERNPS